MDPQVPWPGSRWRRSPTADSYVLRIPARIAATVVGIALVAVACTIAGVAVIDASRTGTIPGAPPKLSPGAIVLLVVAMAVPVIAALVALVQIRRSSLYATRSGVWFWSGASAVMLPWPSIASVEMRQIRRQGRICRYTVVVTETGNAFAVTGTRSRLAQSQSQSQSQSPDPDPDPSEGAGRLKSPCQQTASALVEMVEATTGRNVGITTTGEGPAPAAPRGEVRIRTLPGGGDDEIAVAHEPITPSSAWLVATVPAVAGIAAGFLASSMLNLPGGLIVPSGIGALLAVALWTAGTTLLMATHLRYAIGPDWFAWHYPVAGPWRMIAFSAVDRIDIPVAPPSRWSEQRARAARNRAFVVWIRTNDGKTTAVRLPASGEGEPGRYRERLSEVVTGPLAAVSSERLRTALGTHGPAREGDPIEGEASEDAAEEPSAENGAAGESIEEPAVDGLDVHDVVGDDLEPAAEEADAADQAGDDAWSRGVRWPPVLPPVIDTEPDPA